MRTDNDLERPEKGLFQYFHPDPVTDGKWRIVSHRALTTSEIERRLKLMAALGRDRPPKGELYTFRWPAHTNGE